MYNEQVDWETFHLRKAGENGCVLFWLAKEEVQDCPEVPICDSLEETCEQAVKLPFRQ